MDYHETIFGARDSRDIMDDYIYGARGHGSFFPKTMVVVPMVLPQTNNHNNTILCQWFDILPYYYDTGSTIGRVVTLLRDVAVPAGRSKHSCAEGHE
jgi:hypothetical protein